MRTLQWGFCSEGTNKKLLIEAGRPSLFNFLFVIVVYFVLFETESPTVALSGLELTMQHMSAWNLGKSSYFSLLGTGRANSRQLPGWGLPALEFSNLTCVLSSLHQSQLIFTCYI